MINSKTPFHNSRYELLHDENYLLWRLSPTEELESYWNGRLREDPALGEKIEFADICLKERIFERRTIKPGSKARILEEVYQSVERDNIRREHQRTRIYQWGRYVAAACILPLAGIFLYEALRSKTEEQIIVSRHDAENIQLITSGKTTLFDENVDIQIDNEGNVRIQGGDTQAPAEAIVVDKNALNTLIVPYGKRSKVELADGTKVWLNSGSTLEFPSDFRGDKREISLKGEMYIEVAANKKMPFYVHTSNFNVHVLGTKFNISAYEEQTQSVVLVEGRVDIKSNKRQGSYALFPDEIGVLESDNSFRTWQVDVSQYICWTKGYIMLEETPIEDLLEYIGRYYNVSFRYAKTGILKNLTCNGKLYLSDNLDNVLRAVALSSNTEYKKEDNAIFIISK